MREKREPKPQNLKKILSKYEHLRLQDRLVRSLLLPCRSSFTIEATLALSMVIFAAVALLTPVLILHQQQEAQRHMEVMAERLAIGKYAERYLEKKVSGLNISEDALTGIETGASVLKLSSEIKQDGMSSLDLLSGSQITETDVLFTAKYQAKVPFNFFRLSGFPQELVAYRRAWIGADGNRWPDEAEESEEDPTVYVSIKNTEVYHTTLDCSYLSHIFEKTSGKDIQTKKPPYGGRYMPCAICLPSSNLPVVYYTTGSRSYHTTPLCRTMSSYIQSTTKSRAISEGKHACIRCG